MAFQEQIARQRADSDARKTLEQAAQEQKYNHPQITSDENSFETSGVDRTRVAGGQSAERRMQTVQEGQEDVMQSMEMLKERSGKKMNQDQRKRVSAVRSPENEVAAPKKQKKRSKFNSRQLVIAASSASPVGDDLNYLTPPKPEEEESDDEQPIASNSKAGKLHKKYSNPFLAK